MNHLSKEAHALEDINGVRCAIVEKNVTPQRTEFLKKLLEENGYSVMIAPSPPPKVVAKPAPPPPKATGTPVLVPEQKVEVTNPPQVTPAPPVPLEVPPSPPVVEIPPAPETFTVGVTDFLFHPMLAIYERALKTPEGKIVTVDYWNQQPEKEDTYYWKRDFFTDSL